MKIAPKGSFFVKKAPDCHGRSTKVVTYNLVFNVTCQSYYGVITQVITGSYNVSYNVINGVKNLPSLDPATVKCRFLKYYVC